MTSGDSGSSSIFSRSLRSGVCDLQDEVPVHYRRFHNHRSPPAPVNFKDGRHGRAAGMDRAEPDGFLAEFKAE